MMRQNIVPSSSTTVKYGTTPFWTGPVSRSMIYRNGILLPCTALAVNTYGNFSPLLLF